MHFSTLAMGMLASFASIATAGVVPAERAAATGPGNGISTDTYINCLNDEVRNCGFSSLPPHFDTDRQLTSSYSGGWSTNACQHEGRVTFWRRGRAWSDPADCYWSCKDEIANAIRAGFPERECSHTAGAAQCWMGYNTRQ